MDAMDDRACEAPTGRRLLPGHGVVRDELRIEGFRLVEVSHAPALCLEGHTHDTAKVCIVLDGRVSERCGLEVLSPGVLEPVFRPAHVPHANQYHAHGARSLLVEVDPGDARARTAVEGVAFDRTRGRDLASQLVVAFGARRSSRGRRVVAAVRAILEAFDAHRRPASPAWLDAAREALAAQYATPPTLPELARTLGVHPVYLAQSFRARWGVTTRAYVRSHRVFHALQLVERGVSLADAAADAGFADQSHMTRTIMRERGATPGALRRA